MARAAALALVLFAVLAGDARAAQELPVYVVDGPLPSTEGAYGLLVPGAGPDTSREQALAALVQGEVRNSLRGDLPEEPPLINVDELAGAPEPPYILVALPKGGTQPNDRRYPVVVVAPGYRGHPPVSDSTRIPGLVSIADIAPTALAEDGALGSQPDSDPAATLAALDARIDDHNDSRVPAGLLAGLILIALALLWPKAALLGFGAALLANLALGLAEVSSFWPTLARHRARGRRRRPAPRARTPLRPRRRALPRRDRGGLPRRARSGRERRRALAVRPEPELPLLRALELPRDDAARACPRRRRLPLAAPRLARLRRDRPSQLRDGGREPLRGGRRRRDRPRRRLPAACDPARGAAGEATGGRGRDSRRRRRGPPRPRRSDRAGEPRVARARLRPVRDRRRPARPRRALLGS